MAYQKAYRKTHPKGMSAQDTLPFLQVFKDGMCHVDTDFYSKTIQFEDTNYQIAQQDTQLSIVEHWKEFLHYFDENISLQLTFLNSATNHKDFEKTLLPTLQGDSLDVYRQEFGERVLLENLKKGNNGLHKTKYITIGIHADTPALAKMRLNRIELDVQNILKKMKVKTHLLNGLERLELMHNILHMDGSQPFRFQWPMVAETGLSPKDFIVPPSFTFHKKQSFQTGNTLCKASYFNVASAELRDRILVDLLDTETPQVVTLHIEPYSHAKAIKLIKSRLTSVTANKINYQKKAVGEGFDMDILPVGMVADEKDLGNQLQLLQSGERMFFMSLSVVNSGKTKKALQSTVSQIEGIANTYNCKLEPLDFMQEQGFMSALPIAKNLVERNRSILTNGLSAFIPFTTQELFQLFPNAIFIGLNPLSNNIILVDRMLLANANGVILGGSGTGKSFLAKMLMMQEVLKLTTDYMILCDPEGEYHEIVEAFGGQLIIVSASSPHHINPMDLNLNYGDGTQALRLKASFIFSMCELIAGRREGLSGEERSGIDKCLAPIYAEYFKNPIPENMPTLVEFLEEMKRQNDPHTVSIRASLDMYVYGTQNTFSHRTNVDIDNRLVCYDIKGLDGEMKKLAMLIVQEQVWNRVTANRSQKILTRFYIDEFHLLLQEKETAAHFVEIWKRFRKWGGVPTGITQNVTELLKTREISDIFSNSQFIALMSQQGKDRDILADLLNISSDQLQYISTGNVGEGLLFYGGTIIPFCNKFPKDTNLYKMMSTTLIEDIEKQETVPTVRPIQEE